MFSVAVTLKTSWGEHVQLLLLPSSSWTVWPFIIKLTLWPIIKLNIMTFHHQAGHCDLPLSSWTVWPFIIKLTLGPIIKLNMSFHHQAGHCDLPSSSWHCDLPSSSWHCDLPSSSWHCDLPSSSWHCDLLSSSWHWDLSPWPIIMTFHHQAGHCDLPSSIWTVWSCIIKQDTVTFHHQAGHCDLPSSRWKSWPSLTKLDIVTFRQVGHCDLTGNTVNKCMALWPVWTGHQLCLTCEPQKNITLHCSFLLSELARNPPVLSATTPPLLGASLATPKSRKRRGTAETTTHPDEKKPSLPRLSVPAAAAATSSSSSLSTATSASAEHPVEHVLTDAMYSNDTGEDG